MIYIQLIEEKADPSIKLGDIDEEGDRSVWIRGRDKRQVIDWLTRRHPKIKQQRNGLTVMKKPMGFDDGLDIDLIDGKFRDGEKVHAFYD